MPTAAIGFGLIVAAVIGILVANAFVDTSGNHAAVGQTLVDPTTDQPLPTVPPTFTTAADQTALTTTPATTTQANAQLTPQAMLAVLHTYLGFLPQNPAQAWQLLTPAEQARSGGFGGYQQTWSAVSSVELGATVPRGANTILARIKLNPASGPTTDNFYNVQFAAQNGAVLINDFAVVKQGKRG